ncbi:MAG: hypothetical protein JWP65_3699 [Ramlibacter sp.]|uniref:hypothetical protein n=1 Tax=Ramlibacter sp. TaxID=1917967 RepID=UPI0026048B20|nr:hypothetical protein [Ramlibacter sp.]MDB5753278.1 hypothetical protein [Ramlibacter sp.]
MLVVAIGWLYVALMMAVAEADHSNGSILGAIITFVLYGVGPVALLMYLMATPARRKARKQRETAELEAARAASVEPDGGGEPAADAVPAVRKEP